jgi:hypothetical protein
MKNQEHACAMKETAKPLLSKLFSEAIVWISDLINNPTESQRNGMTYDARNRVYLLGVFSGGIALGSGPQLKTTDWGRGEEPQRSGITNARNSPQQHVGGEHSKAGCHVAMG